MYIEKFLSNHPDIKLSPKILKLCTEGERLMSQSPDPIHDHHHIGRILRQLDRFLKSHTKRPDFEILLPAICWHDVWKGKRQSLNPVKLFYHQLYEGIGSWRIFQKHRANLPAGLAAQIGYAIRKHSQFQFFPLKTFEAKILRDLDDLDIVSAKRLRPLLEKRKSVSTIVRKIGKAFLYFQTNKKSHQKSEFSWTRERLKKQNKIARKFLKWL